MYECQMTVDHTFSAAKIMPQSNFTRHAVSVKQLLLQKRVTHANYIPAPLFMLKLQDITTTAPFEILDSLIFPTNISCTPFGYLYQQGRSARLQSVSCNY